MKKDYEYYWIKELKIDTEIKILFLIAIEQPVNANDIAFMTGYSYTSIYYITARLKSLGYLEEKDKLYSVSEKGKTALKEYLKKLRELIVMMEGEL